MTPPQVEYRRVKLPRTDMLFSACWFDIDESLDIFIRFAEPVTADELAQQLESIGYETTVHSSKWAAPGDEPVGYYEVLITLEAPKAIQKLWASGTGISEVEANTLHAAIDELIR